MLNLLAIFLLILIGGAIFHRVLERSSRQRAIVLLTLRAGYAGLPFLIPPELVLLRPLAALALCIFFLRLYDAHVGAILCAPKPALGPFMASMFNPFYLVSRRKPAEPGVSGKENFNRLMMGLFQVALSLSLLNGLFFIEWSRQSFAVEHVVKSVGFFIGAVGMFQVAASVARLFGVIAREPCMSPYTTVTPALFWRRYNRVVGQFMQEDIFRRLRHKPAFATMIAFTVSGLIHEYVVSIGADRILGYQMAFFLIQGTAVVATQKAKPLGWRRFPWWFATLSFNIVTSLLFLGSIDYFIPFYVNQLPWGL